jgi:hypothetical protein
MKMVIKLKHCNNIIGYNFSRSAVPHKVPLYQQANTKVTFDYNPILLKAFESAQVQVYFVTASSCTRAFDIRWIYHGVNYECRVR